MLEVQYKHDQKQHPPPLNNLRCGSDYVYHHYNLILERRSHNFSDINVVDPVLLLVVMS